MSANRPDIKLSPPKESLTTTTRALETPAPSMTPYAPMKVRTFSHVSPAPAPPPPPDLAQSRAISR